MAGFNSRQIAVLLLLQRYPPTVHPRRTCDGDRGIAVRFIAACQLCYAGPWLRGLSEPATPERICERVEVPEAPATGARQG